MKVCIVRHGSAETGVDGDSQRQLTEKGQQQAERAGCWLRGLIEAGVVSAEAQICVSPYRRAIQTAQAIQQTTGLTLGQWPQLTPDGEVDSLIEQLTACPGDLILVSHLPLVGRLAAKLVEGQVFDQPWSPAECWLLEGDVAAAGCMTVTQVWYPALDEH